MPYNGVPRVDRVKLRTVRCGPTRQRATAAGLWFYLIGTAWLALGAPLALFAQGNCSKSPRTVKLLQLAADAHRAYNERKHDYEKALRGCREYTPAYHDFSVLLFQHQDLEGAFEWIRRGLQVAPNDPGLTVDLAAALLAVGRPQEAVRALDPLPSTARNEFYRGLAYRALRDDRAAQRSFSQALAMGHEDPYDLYALIEEDHALGDREAGLQHFTVFSQRFPDSPWLHVLQGNAYASRHDAANAEAEYRHALQQDPNLPTLHYALGRLAFDRAAYSTASEDFQKEIDLDPPFGEAYLYLGVALRRQGKTADALPYFEKAVGRDPNSALTYTQLASAQTELGKLPEAVHTLKTAKEHFPDDPAFPAQLSNLLDRLGRPQEAKEESALAERLSRRGNPELHNASQPYLTPAEEEAAGAAPPTKTAGADRSPASERTESVKTAAASGGGAESPSTPAERSDPELDTLRDCLARSDRKCSHGALATLLDSGRKDDPEFLDLTAQLLSLDHNYTEALATIQRAIEMEPRRAPYLMTQGQIYQRAHDQIHAIQSFLQAAQLRPGWVEPAYSLGMSFFLFGNEENNTEYYDRAARHFRAALELDANYHKAEFMLGVVAAVENHLDQAREHFERALRLSPQNAYYHLHYGILLNRMGDSSSALREMELAETLDHSNPLTYFNLGLLESRLENYAEARKRLETAVHLDSNLSAAYYCLGGVYRHLGLPSLSQEAYSNFQRAKAREQQEDADPVEAALSPADLHPSSPAPQ